MDYPRDKLARDFFATLALTVFAQARNWQLGHEKYASILFATLALTSFWTQSETGASAMESM